MTTCNERIKEMKETYILREAGECIKGIKGIKKIIGKTEIILDDELVKLYYRGYLDTVNRFLNLIFSDKETSRLMLWTMASIKN